MAKRPIALFRTAARFRFTASRLTGAESFTSLVDGDRTCFPLGADDQHLVYLVSDHQSPD